VKLGCIEIVEVQCGRVGKDVVACGNGVVLVVRYIEAMHVIDELPVADALEKRRLQVVDAIPSHLRNLVGVLLRLEALYVERKDA
jgi:hypothetical protein